MAHVIFCVDEPANPATVSCVLEAARGGSITNAPEASDEALKWIRRIFAVCAGREPTLGRNDLWCSASPVRNVAGTMGPPQALLATVDPK